MSPKTELKYLYAKIVTNNDDEEKLLRYEAQKNVPVIDFYDLADIKKLFSKFKLKEVRQDFIFPYKIIKSIILKI